MEKGQVRYEKILLVEEKSEEREILAAVLGSEGYIVETVATAEEAWDKVKSFAPDLVLLDAILQGMKGYDFCRALRQDTAFPYTPVILFTPVKIDQQEYSRGIESGADGYMEKPFDYPELLSKMRILLRIKSLYDELSETRAELARYVSLPALRSVEMKVKEGVTFDSEQREATVLFSDLRGFTSAVARMEQGEVFRMLNQCLVRQIKVIEEHRGIVDKLSGDEIMAVFEGAEMAENALRCGKEITAVMSDSEKYPDGLELGVGVGINTGQVSVGNLGSETFKKFTAIGHTVNLAARLCGMAQRSQVLFTESTRVLVADKGFSCESLGRVSLKGLAEPIEVFVLKD